MSRPYSTRSESKQWSTPCHSHIATIESLPAAFDVGKAMQADEPDWSERFLPWAGKPWPRSSGSEMAAAVDRHLEGLEVEDAAGRRNGY